MKTATAIVFSALAVLLIACETKNVGGPLGPGGIRVTGVSFSDTTPTAGDTISAQISFQGVSGPFSFTVTFADCVTPPVQTVTAQSGATSASLTFTLDSFLMIEDADGKDCSVNVSGVDDNGSVGAASGTFHVTGISSPLPTLTTLFNAATCVVSAAVSHGWGDDVTVTATTIPASLSTIGQQVVTGGNGTVDFPFSATDIISGGGGDVTFTAYDAYGGTTTSSITVTCPGIGPHPPDHLYAIPMSTAAAVGEPVTIVVLTGDPSSPFQYMTGVTIVTDAASGFEYVDDSFNVGMPGGDPDAVDGIWADDELGLGDGDFLLAPDSFYIVHNIGNGLKALDFNLTPLNAAGDLTVGEGALFNFQATFDTPGTYQLGFQLFNVVNRTYYQDGNQNPDYFWGDISNEHAGVPNSITVL